MALVFALLVVACGFIVWIHLSWHELIPPSEVNVRIDPDGRMRTREIGKGEARIVRLEGSSGEQIRLFVDRSDTGKPRVTLTASRRCNGGKAQPGSARAARLRTLWAADAALTPWCRASGGSGLHADSGSSFHGRQLRGGAAD